MYPSIIHTPTVYIHIGFTYEPFDINAVIQMFSILGGNSTIQQHIIGTLHSRISTLLQILHEFSKLNLLRTYVNYYRYPSY